MQTRKLYYEDCHLFDFTAHVTACRPVEGGFEVLLDATAFYPEGGGQPWDLGELGGRQVLSVREQGAEILHLCDGPLEAGATVEGHIQARRRLDFMQQHTGEHMVSGVIHSRYGWHNVGFHMGKELVTIDFDGPIPEGELSAIEEAVNRAVWANLPVRCWTPDPEELARVTYRSKRALPWPVRIVEVPGMDCCACCGIHTASTGEVGLVKIFSMAKFHQGVRMEMACGQRAFDYLSRVFDQNRLVSQIFSAKILETGSAAQRTLEALETGNLRANTLQKRVFDCIAGGYAGAGNVLHFEEGLTSGQVRDLADRIGQVCGGIAGVLSGTDGKGYSVCLIARELDLRSLGNEMCKTLRGRGGGKAGFFQGSLQAPRQEIEAFFRGAL